MPIYIPPLIKKVAVGTIPTNLNDLADVLVSMPVTGDSLVYNGSSWINTPMASQTELDALRTETIAASSSLQSQINVHTSNISSLQLQINQLTTGIKIVFSEQFSGNGLATTATLNGTITNGSFATGSWSNVNIANTLPAYITDLSGKPIYNSSNIFTRTKISVVSISGAGVVTLSAAPLNGQAYKIWYFYSLQSADKITNYYRDDFVADMETEATSIIASQVQVSTASFAGILSGADSTVQAALDTLDDHLHPQYLLSSTASSISASLDSRLITVENNYATKANTISGSYNNVVVNSQGIVTSGGNILYSLSSETQAASSYLYSLIASTSGSGTGFIPLEGTGIDITPSGSNYIFSLDPNYAFSGNYVSITGDTMSGTLSLPKVNLINNNVTASVSGDIWHYEDTPGEGNGFYINAGGNIKQIDFDSNTAGPIQKIAITNNGDGTINAPSIPVFLYSNSSWSGTYRHYHIPTANNLALTDNSINYLVADYNGGSPIYQVITDPATINNSNIALIATMSRVGTEIHWIPVDWGLATAVKLNNRQINIRRFERSSGLALGETTGRVITIGSGVIWYGHSSYAESAVDSSSNNADFWYHSAGNWTKSIVSTYNNTQYDNGTNLVTLSGFGTQYAVNWVYRYLDGAGLPKIAYVLGSGNYSLAQAQASTVPNIPDILNRTAILVGRIIVAQNASTAYQIDSAFTMVFAGSTVTDHNNLSGLQGGTTSEYYHLTASEHSDLIGASTVASISGDLQSQISAITVPTSATFLTDYDARYVNESDLIVTLGNYATNSTVASISASLNNEILQASTRTIGFVIDGAGTVPASGTYASVVSPFSGTITNWTIISDISGSATLDVWKANGAKPTNANSIVASAKPTLSSSDFATSSTLTGWTTSVATGDVFTVELESISGCNRITLQLGVTV
jgi:hypothetical protein